MLSEAVLSVERTGLPYFVVMVDDSASQQVVDQYADPKTKAAAERAGAGRRASPRPTGWRWPRGWLDKDDGKRPPRAAEAEQGPALPRLDAARPLAEVDKPEDVAPALEKLKKVEAERRPDPARATGVRQVLTELRGVPPSAIVLLTDGQTTDGETLAKAAELAARKGVPLYPIGLGDPEPAARPGADRAAGRRRRLRRRPGPVPGQAHRRRVRRAGGRPSGSRSGTAGSADPKATRELETIRVTAPPDGQPKRVEIGHRPKETGEITYIARGRAQAPRAPDREQPDRAHGQRPQGEAQGPARRQRAALRVPLPEELPRARGDDRPERRPPLVRPRVQRAGPLGPADLPGRQGRAVRLRRGHPRRRRPELPEPVADAEPRRVRHREGGRHPVHRGRELQPAQLPGDAAGDSSCRSSWPRPATRRPWATRSPPFRPELTVEGRSSPIFRFGDDEATSAQIWQNLPELFWFLEAPRKKPAALVLAEHPDARAAPTASCRSILYQFVGAGKSMFNAVDDTWRWRFRVGDRYFGRFWIQTIRFLARSKLLGQKQAEVQTDRRRYQRNQPIQIRVRFPNPAIAPGRRRGHRPGRAARGTGPRKLTLKPSPGTPEPVRGGAAAGGRGRVRGPPAAAAGARRRRSRPPRSASSRRPARWSGSR